MIAAARGPRGQRFVSEARVEAGSQQAGEMVLSQDEVDGGDKSLARPVGWFLSIAITPEIFRVDQQTTSLQRSDGSPVTDQPTSVVLSDDKKTLTVTCANGLPKGSYILLPAVVPQAGQAAVTKQQVNFQVDDH